METSKRSAIIALTLGVISTAAVMLVSRIGWGQNNIFAISSHGYVPVICQSSMNASLSTPSPGETIVGWVSTTCNDPSGFQVWAEHPAELAAATLIVDGRRIPMSPSGKTLIDEHCAPGNSSHEAAIAPPPHVAPGKISLRIVAP
jgi:hypothetical protein